MEEKMDSKKILILVGHSSADNQIEKSLIEANFDVIQADDLNQMISQLKNEKPDIVVIDDCIVSESMQKITYLIRKNNQMVGLIFFAKNKTVDERVLALDEGADDCLREPFDIGEFVAKTKALTCRIDRLYSI